MGGTSRKETWHILRVRDLTYFSRSQRSKFGIGIAPSKWRHVLLPLLLLAPNFIHMYTWMTSCWSTSRGFILFLVWPPGGKISKQKKCNNSLAVAQNKLEHTLSGHNFYNFLTNVMVFFEWYEAVNWGSWWKSQINIFRHCKNTAILKWGVNI